MDSAQVAYHFPADFVCLERSSNDVESITTTKRSRISINW